MAIYKNKKISNELFSVSKKVGMAIADYDMLRAEDKIIVAVSGGKDSLSLLRLLKFRQSFVPIRFDIKAVHVDMGMPGFPLDELRKYLAKENIPFHIEKIDFLKGGRWEDINCFWCAWNRRKTLFQLAGQWGYNKVAFGHHLDDIVETMLLNLFYKGEISTMKPKQVLFKGKLVIIRPLAYTEEKAIRKMARQEGIPTEIDRYPCPNNDVSKRLAIKQLIEQLYKDNPAVKINIFRSLQRIKSDYLLDKDMATEEPSA